MDSSQSAPSKINMPLHLMDSNEEATTISLPSARMIRRGVVSFRVLACCALLAAAAPTANAFSPSATQTAGASKSLVDQARMIRELKNGSPESERALQRLVTDTKSYLDNDAMSAALFDDGFNSSLESAVLMGRRRKSSSNKSAKKQAEEFDRFMEEDATVASIIQENIKPGSLVDEVQQNKGADIVDNNMEAILQQEAADRRKFRDAETTASLAPAIKVTRKSKLASNPDAQSKASSKKSTLLTREEEYELAYTIQAGTRVHKIKAEYESSQSQPLSKKQWAQLADMSPNELRKLISDYRTAKQELVSSNMGLVHAVVKSYSRKAKYRGVSIEELIQEGSLGLIRAAELFDPAKGLRFSTYATIWVKGVLSNSNSLEDVITLPNRERALWNKVRAAWEEMQLEDGESGIAGKGGKPTIASAKEIAKRLDMKQSLVENHLRRMACVSNVLSLDYQYATSTRSGYTDNTQDALMNSAQFGTDADLAEQTQFKADLVAGLVRTLTEKEVTLIRLRYGLEDGTEYTIKECAEKMGINRETARLLQHKCLKKLREASNMESLQEYLLTVA